MKISRLELASWLEDEKDFLTSVAIQLHQISQSLENPTAKDTYISSLDSRCLAEDLEVEIRRLNQKIDRLLDSKDYLQRLFEISERE
jgi:hypothetical protein